MSEEYLNSIDCLLEYLALCALDPTKKTNTVFFDAPMAKKYIEHYTNATLGEYIKSDEWKKANR